VILSDGSWEVVTSTFNITESWVHKWNEEITFSPDIYQALDIIIFNIVNYWKNKYWLVPNTWLWIDFAYNLETPWDVKIFEANARYTAPSNPKIARFFLKEKYWLPKWWKWKLIQKCDTNWLNIFDLNLPYIMTNDTMWRIKEEWWGILVYTPVYLGRYQGIIIYWENDEKIKQLEQRLKKDIKKYSS
jgi:hypothetical protein